MNPLFYGFKILNFGNLRGWKVLEIGADVPLTSRENCPAGCGELLTIAVLVGNKGQNRLRVGVCGVCGYWGYIDRPRPDWINNFYLNTWDGAEERYIPEEIKKIKENQPPRDIKKAKKLAAIFEKYGVSQTRPVFEIGCGYGGALKALYDLGYENLSGVENSAHRAQIGKAAHGFEILRGAFEKQKLTNASYGAIFSHHVLEHTYDPQAVISHAAKRQKAGDILIISAPNAQEEPALTKLLYFPHLHSFTPESLKRIYRDNAYEAVEDLSTPSEVYIVGRRAAGMAGDDLREENRALGGAAERLARSLDLRESRPGGKKIIYWYKVNTDKAKQMAYYENRTADALRDFLAPYFLRFWHKNKRLRPLRSLVAEALTNRYTDFKDSPIEVQFEGNIKLTYK